MKRSIRKGYKVFAIHVIEYDNNEDPKLTYIPFIRYFVDVFPEEVLGLPPKRELEFSIELIPGMVPVSKDPY